MQNIIVITFKSGLIQYIPHNIEALNFISANFADIENYIVVEPAAQQNQVKEVVVEPVDLSNLTKREVIALAAALKSIQVETGGEFGTIDGAYNYKQNVTNRNFANALRSLEMQTLILADGSEAFFSVDQTCINVTKGLYDVRQYVYDQAGLK